MQIIEGESGEKRKNDQFSNICKNSPCSGKSGGFLEKLMKNS